jgi:hypothetical protein
MRPQKYERVLMADGSSVAFSPNSLVGRREHLIESQNDRRTTVVKSPWLSRVLVGVLVLGCGVVFNAQAASYDFKGLVVGSTVDVQELPSKYGLTCKARNGGGTLCEASTTLLGMPAKETVYVVAQGFVASIDVYYETTTVQPKMIAAELAKKYGPPQRNLANFEFDWKDAQGHTAHLEHRRLKLTAQPPRAPYVAPTVKKGDI